MLLVWRGALRKLPAPHAQRIAELLDQMEAVAVTRDHQRIRGFVDYRVDAGAAVGTSDVVLAQRQPVVPVHLA